MDRIQTINVDKFQDALYNIGEGPCVKFDCDRQQECGDEKSSVKHLDIGLITTVIGPKERVRKHLSMLTCKDYLNQ